MLKIYDGLEQRSDRWYEVRRGIVTASVVGKLVTTEAPDPLSVDCPKCRTISRTPCVSLAHKLRTEIKTIHDARAALVADLPAVLTVADNDTSRGITATLVAERITGVTEESFISADMWRGIEHEPYARDVYSGYYQQAVECGFMRRDEDGWTLGWSPDGLVADEGGIEIKCPKAKEHIRTILADEVPLFYVGQCQAALLVSGRKWIDYVSFHAGLPLFVKRVLPDPAWHEAIVAACVQFEKTAGEMTAAYTQATKNLPATERLEMEIVI